MTTPAPDDKPTRATTPAQSSESEKHHRNSDDADTAATIPARPIDAGSPTQATIPMHGKAGESTAETVTSATQLHVDATLISKKPASGSHDGEIWGDFSLGKMLGRGGMGAVYSGRQISLDRPVAIKLLSEHLDSDDFRKRFLLEARAAARINSPHVVQVYFAGSHTTENHGEVHFFAMEYVEGTDLAQKLKKGGRLTPVECLDYVIQAARSLVALADHNIVHRDIKPANFMLTDKGQLKLMDFGLVKFASEAHGLTQTGTVMGTVNYFSPEQGRGEACDHRTDIYALGVMFYEMLTGKLPFTGGDATSVIYQHIHAEPKPPRIHNPEVTEPFQSVVMKCLEKNPDDRYLKAADLLEDLLRIQRGEKPLAVLSPTIRKKKAEPVAAESNKQRLIVAGAVIIAAVIVAVAIILSSGKNDDKTTVIANADVTTTNPASVNSGTTPPDVVPNNGQPAAQNNTNPTTPETTTPDPTIPAAAVVPPITGPTAEPKIEPTIETPPVTSPVDVTPPPPTPPTPPTTPVVATNPVPDPVVPPAAPIEPVAVTVPTTPEDPNKPDSNNTTPIPVPADVTPPAPTPPVVAVTPPKPIEPAPPIETKPIDPVIAKVTPDPAPVKPIINPEPTPKPTPPIEKPTPPPIGFSAPIETTIKVSIPAGDELLAGKTFLWWMTGPGETSGRLAARSTTSPENFWTAPAIPGETVLNVATVGNKRVLSIPLRATDAPLTHVTKLAPFARATFHDERRIQDLHRDSDGSWWMVDVQEAAINRMDASWLKSSRVELNPKPEEPAALALQAQHIAILDRENASLLVFNRDGTPHQTIKGLSRPTDVITGPNNSWYVADQKAGGILVYNLAGERTATLARTTPGATGFELLTKLATDGTLVYALDVDAKKISVFDKDQVVATWKLESSDRPVDMTYHQQLVYVLMQNGMIRGLDKRGDVVRVIQPAATKLPDDSLGSAAGIACDNTGEIYVTYPDREMIARHVGIDAVSLRHARTWTWRAYAADALGNIYGLNRDNNRIVTLDADGWRTRPMVPAKELKIKFDSPTFIAAHPLGTAIAVYDEDNYKVTRLDLSGENHVIFGGEGSVDGKFKAVAGLAIDKNGRTFVLDTGNYHVAIFNADGSFLMNVGRYERGDKNDMLRIPRSFCISPDGTQLFIFDEESLTIKHFSVDYDTKQIRHVRNIGGKESGFFTRVTGMGCDERGRLYVLDYKRGDLQVFDSTASGAPLITSFKGTDFNIRRMLYLALNPNGLLYIIGGDQATGLRWEP